MTSVPYAKMTEPEFPVNVISVISIVELSQFITVPQVLFMISLFLSVMIEDVSKSNTHPAFPLFCENSQF